jgi:hypothetical protein
MPFARIITRCPEHTNTLSQQLQLQGFSVEIAAPEDTHLSPADLEIEFEICDRADVLRRASQMAAQLQTDVVVAPGVLDLVPEPAAVVETHPLEELQPVVIETLTQPPQIPSGEEEFSYPLPQVDEGFWASPGTKLHKSFGHLFGYLAKAGSAARNGVASIASTIATRAREFQEQMRVRRAEAQAARERRQVEAQEHAAFQQQEAERQKQSELAPTAISQQSQQQPVQPAVDLKQFRREQSRQPRQSQFPGIFAGAAAASVLFMLGMVLAHIHPRSPLPPELTKAGTEQHVPFGAVIVQGRPAQSRNNIGKTNALPPRRTAQLHEGTPSVAPKKPQPHPRRRFAHESDDDVVTNDVVVKHFPMQNKKPLQQAKQVGMKRYSDLN